MFTNWDARDVGSLEEVFRSHEFGQAPNTMGGREGSYPARREDGLFAKEFSRPLTAVHSHDVDGEGEPRLLPGGGGPEAAPVEETELPEQRPQVESSGGGGALGAEHAEAPWRAPSKRHATRYGTIASVVALAALVAAGIMAGVDHHPRSSVSAQGTHNSGTSAERIPGPRRGVTGLGSSERVAHGRARVWRPVVAHGCAQRARFGQRARGAGDSCRTCHLRRYAGPTSGVRQLLRWRQQGHGLPVASRQRQPRWPCRAQRREHGECRRVDSRDGRRPTRELRAGGRIDRRRREQRRQYTRSDGQRVDRITTANCRLVAVGLRPQRAARPESTVARNSGSRVQSTRETTLRQPRETARD